MDRIKNISLWAKNNLGKARILIIVAHLLVGFFSVILGMLFYVNDFVDGDWLVWMMAAFSLVAFAMYPRYESPKQHSSSYTKRKILDFSFVLCYAFAIAFGLNNYLNQGTIQFNVSPQTSFNELSPSVNFVVHKVVERPILKKKNNLFTSFGKFKKIKKQIRRNLMILKEKNDFRTNFIKVLAVLGVIAIILFLGFYVALLVCGISCAGYEAIAVITLILGWGGLIYGSVVGIVDIMRWADEGSKEGPSTKKEKMKLLKRYALAIIGVLIGLAGVVYAFL